MTQIMLPAVFSRKDFDNILRSMSDEDAASFAATNRTTFASCFSLSAPGSGTADARPAASPGPAKAREPKASPAVDKEALAAQVFAYVKSFPGCRSEDVDVSALSGMDAKAANRLVRAILEKAVDSKAAFCEGNGRGRRYKVAVKTTEPEAAE